MIKKAIKEIKLSFIHVCIKSSWILTWLMSHPFTKFFNKFCESMYAVMSERY